MTAHLIASGDLMHARRKIGGFTYLALLFMVAIMGATVAVSAAIYSTAQQRDHERDLLSVGNEFRRAIGSYYEHTPGTVKRYPVTLEQLLKDDRHLTNVRHLRRIYTDPMTGGKTWGLVHAADGGIMGVFSLSDTPAIKRTGFRQRDLAFEGAERYSQWRFVYEPLEQLSPDIAKPLK